MKIRKSTKVPDFGENMSGFEGNIRVGRKILTLNRKWGQSGAKLIKIIKKNHQKTSKINEKSSKIIENH